MALVFAEEAKNGGTKQVESSKKDKRGLYGALGYGIGGYGIGGLGYGLGGLNTYSAGVPVSVSHGISTVLTKEVAVPVPQPVPVPVEKQVPYPVKVSILIVYHSRYSLSY